MLVVINGLGALQRASGYRYPIVPCEVSWGLINMKILTRL